MKNLEAVKLEASQRMRAARESGQSLSRTKVLQEIAKEQGYRSYEALHAALVGEREVGDKANEEAFLGSSTRMTVQALRPLLPDEIQPLVNDELESIYLSVGQETALVGQSRETTYATYRPTVEDLEKLAVQFNAFQGSQGQGFVAGTPITVDVEYAGDGRPVALTLRLNPIVPLKKDLLKSLDGGAILSMRPQDNCGGILRSVVYNCVKSTDRVAAIDDGGRIFGSGRLQNNRLIPRQVRIFATLADCVRVTRGGWIPDVIIISPQVFFMKSPDPALKTTLRWFKQSGAEIIAGWYGFHGETSKDKHPLHLKGYGLIDDESSQSKIISLGSLTSTVALASSI